MTEHELRRRTDTSGSCSCLQFTGRFETAQELDEAYDKHITKAVHAEVREALLQYGTFGGTVGSALVCLIAAIEGNPTSWGFAVCCLFLATHIIHYMARKPG